MAISPRSRGLGNIGSIVNRQGMASPTRPTRPAPKPAPKLAPAPMTRNPFTSGTTTMAQRQASQPFRSTTKPVNKIDPMAGQQRLQPVFDAGPGNPIAQPMPMPMPAPQPFNPDPNPGYMPNIMPVVRPPLPPQFNQPQPGQQPSFQDIFGVGQDPYAPGYNGPGISNDFGPGEMINQYGFPDQQAQTGQQGGGIFGGNLPGMVGNAVGQGLGQMFGPVNRNNYDLGGPQYNSNQNNFPSLGQMFGAPTVDAGGPAGQQPGPMFGNPNPMDFVQASQNQMNTIGISPTPNMLSDYDQLEGSAFNTNSSSGSLFGGGGFMGR